MTREVLTYHTTTDGQYRAVVVRWHKDRFTRVHTSTTAYQSRTVRDLWNQLHEHNHIPSSVWVRDDAYRTFAIVGKAN